MKRDCMILLISMCLITMTAPKGLCKGLQISEEKTGTVKAEASVQEKTKQAEPDKTASQGLPAKEDRRTGQIKGKLRSLGIASRVTIMLKNGNERYGSIEGLDEGSFRLAEVDLNQVFTVAYSDVKKVREGYGNPNQFTGKRWNPIWAKISLVAVIVMFVVVIPLSVPRT